MEQLSQQTGLPIDQLDDVMKYLGVDADELTKLLKVTTIEKLLGIPEMNMKYLVDSVGMGITSEEIANYLARKGIDISSINGMNVDELVGNIKKSWQLSLNVAQGKAYEIQEFAKFALEIIVRLLNKLLSLQRVE